MRSIAEAYIALYSRRREPEGEGLAKVYGWRNSVRNDFVN